MDDKIFELPQTNQTISAMSADIATLLVSINAKKEQLRKKEQEYQETIKSKDIALSELQVSAEAALNTVDGVISQIYGMLENDGSGNDNN